MSCLVHPAPASMKIAPRTPGKKRVDNPAITNSSAHFDPVTYFQEALEWDFNVTVFQPRSPSSRARQQVCPAVGGQFDADPAESSQPLTVNSVAVPCAEGGRSGGVPGAGAVALGREQKNEQATTEIVSGKDVLAWFRPANSEPSRSKRHLNLRILY